MENDKVRKTKKAARKARKIFYRISEDIGEPHLSQDIFNVIYHIDQFVKKVPNIGLLGGIGAAIEIGGEVVDIGRQVVDATKKGKKGGKKRKKGGKKRNKTEKTTEKTTEETNLIHDDYNPLHSH